MRKTTRGRHVQHVHGRIQGFYQFGRGKYAAWAELPMVQGRAIIHAPEKPSPALTASTNAAWVHWKDTDGARRRKWA